MRPRRSSNDAFPALPPGTLQAEPSGALETPPSLSRNEKFLPKPGSHERFGGDPGLPAPPDRSSARGSQIKQKA